MQQLSGLTGNAVWLEVRIAELSPFIIVSVDSPSSSLMLEMSILSVHSIWFLFSRDSHVLPFTFFSYRGQVLENTYVQTYIANLIDDPTPGGPED